MTSLITKIVFLFPIWISISSILALWKPGLFLWFQGDSISYSLGAIMLAMGLTLKVEDFQRVFLQPIPIVLGVLLQYTIMPLSGLLVSKVLNLSPEFSAGLVLVASCPGGTASNVLTFLAGADVALSVTLTVVSTILGIILTPLLTSFLIGSTIEVNTIGLLGSTIRVIVVPVLLGVILSKYAKVHIEKIFEFLPLLSIVLIILIVSSIIAASRNILLESGLILGTSVFLVHSLGFFMGYLIIKLLLKKEIIARTISIEVGMQNSGLGVVLARENFTSPLVAVPPAISSLFHSLISSLLVFLWKWIDRRIVKK
jgi:BASS family bile acid:Na+ symporter